MYYILYIIYIRTLIYSLLWPHLGCVATRTRACWHCLLLAPASTTPALPTPRWRAPRVPCWCGLVVPSLWEARHGHPKDTRRCGMRWNSDRISEPVVQKSNCVWFILFFNVWNGNWPRSFVVSSPC